jgi:hypothetical protein
MWGINKLFDVEYIVIKFQACCFVLVDITVCEVRRESGSGIKYATTARTEREWNTESAMLPGERMSCVCV